VCCVSTEFHREGHIVNLPIHRDESVTLSADKVLLDREIQRRIYMYPGSQTSTSLPTELHLKRLLSALDGPLQLISLTVYPCAFHRRLLRQEPLHGRDRSPVNRHSHKCCRSHGSCSRDTVLYSSCISRNGNTSKTDCAAYRPFIFHGPPKIKVECRVTVTFRLFDC